MGVSVIIFEVAVIAVVMIFKAEAAAKAVQGIRHHTSADIIVELGLQNAHASVTTTDMSARISQNNKNAKLDSVFHQRNEGERNKTALEISIGISVCTANLVDILVQCGGVLDLLPLKFLYKTKEIDVSMRTHRRCIIPSDKIIMSSLVLKNILGTHRSFCTYMFIFRLSAKKIEIVLYGLHRDLLERHFTPRELQ